MSLAARTRLAELVRGAAIACAVAAGSAAALAQELRADLREECCGCASPA